MKHFFNAILFSFLLISLPSFSQNGIIKGNIKTADNENGSFVTVIIKNTQKGASADINGLFTITDVEPGSYILLTSFLGLETKEVPVIVKANETTTIPTIFLSEKINEFNEIVIRANTQNKESEFVAKIKLKDIENSQSYQVVSKEIIRSQQVNNLEDAMRNATGVSIVFPATGRSGDGGTYYTSRGFTTNASLINGVAGAVYNNPDASNIERIEVMKGPSATLFGSSLTSFGGAINVITKRAQQGTLGSVGLTTGSWGLMRLDADYNTSIGDSKITFFRVNASTHHQNSFQDYGFNKRVSVAPSILYQPNDRMSLRIETQFSQIKATLPCWYYADSATTGVISADQLNINDKNYYLGEDLYPTTKTANAMATLNWKINSHWNSQSIVSSSTNDSEGPLPYLWFISDTSLTRNIQVLEGGNTQLNIQQNFQGEYAYGKWKHRLIIGADYYQNALNSTYKWYGSMLDTVYTNQPNPNYLSYNRDQFNNSDYSYFFGSYTGIQLNKRTGAYVSDVISWNDKLFLQLAARYDYYINSGYTDATQDTTIGNFEQGGFSPKLGIVYQIKKIKSVFFANYQNSFQNVNGSDFDGNIFIPQQANQLEGGVKWNIWKNRLHGTLSYYDIQVTNSVRTDPEHPTFSIQDGTQRSKGFEADLTYNGSKGLLVTAGYGYNDNIYTEADESVKGRRPVESGAAHLAHAFASYTIMNGVLKNFNINSSMNYSSKNSPPTIRSPGVFYIPSYTVFNGGIGYSTGKYNLALTVNNITSERYWVGWNNLALQKPREIIGSVRFNF